MKIKAFVSIFALSIAFVSTKLSLPAFAEGSSAKGGGDSYAQEFTSLGHIAALTATKYIPEMSPQERTSLTGAVKSTRVVSSDHLFLQGAEVDAINHPFENPPRIEVSRSRWDGLKGKFVSKVGLVYHEYSVIAGVDDQRYAVSAAFLQKLKSSSVMTRRMGEVLDFAKIKARAASNYKNHANQGTERGYCYSLGVLGQLLRNFRDNVNDAQMLDVAIDPAWLELSTRLPDVETLSFDLCQPLNWSVVNGHPNDGLEAAIKAAGEVSRVLEDSFMLIEEGKYTDL